MKEFIEKLIERLEEEIQDVSESQGSYEVESDMSITCSHIMGTLRDVKNRIIPKLAEEYYANTPQKSAGGWIPCSERLPNYEKDFLVTLRDGDVKVARYEKEENIWVDIIEGYFEYPVVAWCELPEPYKKGSEMDE